MFNQQQKLSFIAGEMPNGTVILEGSLVVSYETKHTVNIWSSNHVSWYLPGVGGKGGMNTQSTEDF